MKTLLLIVGVLITLNLNSWGQTFSPENNETNVSIDQNISLTFSEAISFHTDGFHFIHLYKNGESNFDKEWFIYVTGGIAPFHSSEIVINSNSITINTTSDFELGTNYHLVVPDALTNTDGFSGTDENSWSFTTTGPPIWTSGPSLSDQSPSNVTLNGRTDQDGKSFFVIINSSEDPPNKEQIKSGYNSNNNPANIADSIAVIANQPFSQSIDISSLTSGNYYTLYVVAFNGNYYSDPIVTKTIDLVSPNLNTVSPTNGSTNIDINTIIKLNFSEKIFGANKAVLDNSNIQNYIKLQTGAGPTDVPYSISFNNGGDTLTLTPSTLLDDSTTYTINFISEFEDQFGNVQSGLSMDRTFTTEEVISWLGNDTSWGSEPSNWSNWEGNSNPDGSSILIPSGLTNYPQIVSETVNLNNVYIESGASLTNNGGSITVSGQLVLQSSTNQNASYLPLAGTLDVTDSSKVRVEQVIAYPDRNYFVSSPVIGATRGSAGITDAAVYYDNTTDAYIYLNDDLDELVVGRGHVVRNPNNIVFSGDIFQNDLQLNVPRTAGQGLGWNLIGNPYTASIDLTELGLNNVDSTVWIFKNDPGHYATYNIATNVSVNLDPVNAHILPSNQSFWIRVNKDYTSGTVGFSRTKTYANSHSYLKSASTQSALASVKLATNFNGRTDETAIVFAPTASAGYDQYDSDKMLSYNSNICDLYSKSGSRSLAINSLPSPIEGVTIDLGFINNAGPSESCKISVTANTLPTGSSVILEDKYNDMMTDITSGTAYVFSSDKTGAINDRFVIHFAEGTSTNTERTEIDKKTQIISNKSEIIAYIVKLNNPQYKLFDINGRLLGSGNLNEGRNVVKVNHKGGIIFVITHSEGTETFKTVF